MTKTELFLKESRLYPALILENYFSPRKKRILINSSKYSLCSIPVIIILAVILNVYGISDPAKTADFLIPKLIGLALLSIGIYIMMRTFEMYFSSVYYFEYIARNNYQEKETYTFSAGRILMQAERDNVLVGFLKPSGIGRKIMSRLGISEKESDLLLMRQIEIKNPPIFNPNSIPLVKISHIVDFLYEKHEDFRSLLSSHGLKEKDLEETMNWVVYNIESEEYNHEWWTREKLSRIPGVGSDWSFGKTFLLSKYSRNILNDKEVNSEAVSFSSRARETEQIQSILARRSEANAMLVGLPGQEKMEVVWNLCRKIKNKTAVPELIDKKPLLFLTSNFVSATEEKEEFVENLTTILTEAINAGDILLIIDNFPKLILQAKQFGLNLYEIIEPYLASAGDQVIALSDTEYFHTLIENDKNLMYHFETVLTKPLLLDDIVKIIAREAINLEKIYEILYTYPAILEIAKGAEYYFPEGVSSDKARDLLAEISPWAVENSIEIVGRDEVLIYIEKKSGIPTSSISTNEKEKLLNLENLLMKRVIAQREAVFSVSSAIRRNRAGIRNENRPLGSFLFLGPTGVGKTETAKALAEVLFSDEKLLMRLDMSEYQNEESMSRLIGSQENNTQGILANMLREHPYGVLLLDEFEKTNKNVLNLFLQIIDEGYFSDAFGKKVNARNIMFIATSNAGAEKIFEMVSAKKDLKKYESEIISTIIKDNVFKPELLNRFDATVLFHPLTKENLYEIAKLMLEKVAKRLSEKGIILSIDKELIDFVVKGGYNPTFGARPMNRLIQNTIEQHLADLIIRDELSAGQTVNFKVLSNNSDKDDLKPVIA